MDTSDDEIEDVLQESVTNYHFENDAEVPVSFARLPIIWNTSETIQSSELKIYVRGNAAGGLEKIYKPVKAWKFDISDVKPEISVLCKDNSWIKLQKPRQSFEEEYVRTILVTVNFLHLVKRNPELPGKRIWKKLSNIFSLHDTKPSPKDLLHHRALIEQAWKHDESLKKSKCFMAVLERNPQRNQKADEDALGKGRSEFVVNDDDVSSDDLGDDSGDEEDGSDGEQDDSADEDDDDEEPFDSVCSICDEGGPLLCCEGSCMRSFHATLRAGKPSKCRSLGFTEKEVQAMPSFKCQNCQYKLHQCFLCGKLGSSDKQAGTEVFQCVNATCGYFYHPRCIAKRLCTEIDAAKELEKKICAGESFTCPLHICAICKHAGDKSNPELQMAVCRRCPKAYHKKCLPKKIAFEEDEDAGIEQRAWEGLLVDRILIYCLKHELLEDLGTPERDHIKFTLYDEKEKGVPSGVSAQKVPQKKKMSVLRAPSQGPSAVESKKRTLEDSDTDKKNDVKVLKLQKRNTSKNLSSEKKPVVTKVDGSSGIEEHKCFQRKDVVKPTQTEKLVEAESTKLNKAAVRTFVLDADSEKSILDLMNEASSMITMDDIIGKHEKLIYSRSYKQKMDPCKSITLGKVEGSCKAVREAAKKLDEGSSVEEAKEICEPMILNQMYKWKGKLRVYLAPFLHGMRYTSYGRHFTKPEKLKEIADALHWYANDDDTIVDFCCGANDFSLFMKENLDGRGMKCNFKNYDLFRPKKDFCFEERDWMGIRSNELPTGSKLIMGINPPFGVKACKANQFINKALEFKPKLIVLIVPPETERLDKKKEAYDLIWEIKDQLSGKSFYLPGSVDVNDKQMEDWNKEPPRLYLWSRRDWTSKHMEIAKKYHHLPGEPRESTPTHMLDRDSSFKNRGQSCKVDIAAPQTLQPEGVKESLLDRDSSFKNRGQSCKVDNAAAQTFQPEGVKEARLDRDSSFKNRGQSFKVDNAALQTLQPEGVKEALLDRDSSFKNRGQSCEVDNATPQTLQPEGVKQAPVAKNEDLEKRSTGKVHNINKRVNFASKSKSNKKASKQKRKQEAITVMGGAGGSSQSYKRQRSSPDKPRHEVPHCSPSHEVAYQSSLGTRAERQVRDLMHSGSPSSGHCEHSANYGDSYYPGYRASLVPQNDVYPTRRETWEGNANHDYPPRNSVDPTLRYAGTPDYAPRNLVNTNFGYERSNIHGYGMDHAYNGSVEQRFVTPPQETSFYPARANNNNTSAMDKYSFSLDTMNNARRAAPSSYGAPHPNPSIDMLLHHQQQQAPLRQGYPSVPMGFAPRPTHPYHHPSSGGWLDG